ncbi:MAG TPA: tetratricopeptide repeat protein [Gemmatimonadales bacterium]|nr:tetratricopeptide repeat protein [Gemmatimonadales bacterium]
MASFAEESALLRELDQLAASGRHREVLDRLATVPSAMLESRTRFALLAAETHGRLGDLVAGARWAETALGLARARRERHAELRALNYQGAIALRRGDGAESERRLDEALELARELGDHGTQARCLNNLGILANMRGDRRTALANYRLALAAYQQVGMTRGIAETQHNIGITLRDQGDLRGALAAAEEALRLAGEAGDERLATLAATGRAELHLLLGDTPLAAVELERAAARYEAIGFRAGLAEVRRLQAAVARVRGLLEDAARLLEEAARLAAEHGLSDVLADIARDRAADTQG